MKFENDKVVDAYFLNLLDISAEDGETWEDYLFQWVKPLQLDDDDEKLIFKLSYELNVDVKRILFKVQNDKCRGETYSFKQTMPRPSQPLCVDFISANYSNNNYTLGFNYSIFTKKGDDEDGDNNDNGREDVAQCDQSQYSLTSFISVVNFTHNT